MFGLFCWLPLSVLSLTAIPRVCDEQEAGPAFEVLVLGTHHAPGMFLSAEYTPAHIRATLEAAKPDVVAVESHPRWFEQGRFHVVTYEAQGVAVPFARERGIPVHGVDWKDIEAWDRDEERRSLQRARRVQQMLSYSGSLDLSFFGKLIRRVGEGDRERDRRRRDIDWEYFNDVHSDEHGKSRWGGISPDDKNFAARRDRGIAANILEVMRDHPGKRLVVVIGAHHKTFLDILLARHEGVKVLRLGDDVPLPSDAQIEAAWTVQDLIACLGHNLDTGHSYFHAELADLDRMQGLLEELELRGERPDAARYFRARIDALSGRSETAAQVLGDLIESGTEGDVYPFPMREWRMRYSLSEAARIERARLHLAAGEQQEARRLLEPVAAAVEFRLSRLELTRPRELRRIEAIKDAGFEAGERASDYYSGWYSHLPTGRGSLAFVGDEVIRLEGERSLRLDVLESCPYGFHLRQEVRIPSSSDSTERHLRLGLSLRGEGIDEVIVEAVIPFSSETSDPFVSQRVELEPDAWARGEIELVVPDRGEFGFVVRFSGEPGDRLWLDDATPLPVEYMTIPREWSRLAKARAFLATLLDEGAPTGPASATNIEPRAKGGLTDPGFELTTLAASPMDGWFCHEASTGKVEVASDAETKVEGERSLRIGVITPRKQGLIAVLQVASLPPGMRPGEEVEFSVALRSPKAVSVGIVLGVWPVPHRMEEIGTNMAELAAGDWSRHTARFLVPAEPREIGFFLYLPNEEGARVWMDDARLTVVD